MSTAELKLGYQSARLVTLAACSQGQLSDAGCDLPCLILGHQVRRGTSTRLQLEVDIGMEFYGIDAPHFRTKLFGWRKNTGPAIKGAAKGI